MAQPCPTQSVQTNQRPASGSVEDLNAWFALGWQVINASTHVPLQGSETPRVLEVTTLVLQHDA